MLKKEEVNKKLEELRARRDKIEKEERERDLVPRDNLEYRLIVAQINFCLDWLEKERQVELASEPIRPWSLD